MNKSHLKSIVPVDHLNLHKKYSQMLTHRYCRNPESSIPTISNIFAYLDEAEERAVNL